MTHRGDVNIFYEAILEVCSVIVRPLGPAVFPSRVPDNQCQDAMLGGKVLHRARDQPEFQK